MTPLARSYIFHSGSQVIGKTGWCKESMITRNCLWGAVTHVVSEIFEFFSPKLRICWKFLIRFGWIFVCAVQPHNRILLKVPTSRCTTGTRTYVHLPVRTVDTIILLLMYICHTIDLRSIRIWENDLAVDINMLGHVFTSNTKVPRVQTHKLINQVIKMSCSSHVHSSWTYTLPKCVTHQSAHSWTNQDWA